MVTFDTRLLGLVSLGIMSETGCLRIRRGIRVTWSKPRTSQESSKRCELIIDFSVLIKLRNKFVKDEFVTKGKTNLPIFCLDNVVIILETYEISD